MKKFYEKKEKKIKNKNLILNNLLKSKGHIGCSLIDTHSKSFDYLVGFRRNQSIINLDLTVQSLLRVLKLIKKVFIMPTKKDKNIVIVSNDIKTQYFKKNIFKKRTLLILQKKRIHFHFVNNKWVGGLLTNPKISKYLNKATLVISFNDIKDDTLINESLSCKKPLISFINTNTNPNLVEYPIIFNNNNLKVNFFIIELFIKYINYLTEIKHNVKFKKKI